MDQTALFDSGSSEGCGRVEQTETSRLGRRRLRQAVRNQVTLQECSLDELLPAEHEARIVWEYVSGLDVSELKAKIQAVEGGPGQAPPDPRILLGLWL